MSDNASCGDTHIRSLREPLTRGVRHPTTKPSRPRTNEALERFMQTLELKWAYGLVYTSSEHRRRALPHWLNHSNRSRPHSSLGGRSPISRARNVCRQDS